MEAVGPNAFSIPSEGPIGYTLRPSAGHVSCVVILLYTWSLNCWNCPSGPLNNTSTLAICSLWFLSCFKSLVGAFFLMQLLIVANFQPPTLVEWYWQGPPLAPLPPTAVRWDTFWWEDQSEHARPVDNGLDKHLSATVRCLLWSGQAPICKSTCDCCNVW